MLGFTEYGKRAGLIVIAMQMFQRLDHRGHQIGAAANRLGNDRIRVLLLVEFIGGRDKVVEFTAEACPRYFSHVEPAGAERVGIDQIIRLIIGHDTHFAAVIHIVTGQSTNGGRFSGAKKTANHDESYKWSIVQIHLHLFRAGYFTAKGIYMFYWVSDPRRKGKDCVRGLTALG